MEKTEWTFWSTRYFQSIPWQDGKISVVNQHQVSSQFDFFLSWKHLWLTSPHSFSELLILGAPGWPSFLTFPPGSPAHLGGLWLPMTVTSFAVDMAGNIPLLSVNRARTGLSGIGWTQIWGKLSVFKPVYGKWEKELARARRATSEAGGWAAILFTEKVLDNFTESGVGKYVKLFFPCCLKNNPSLKSRYPPFTLSMLKWQLVTGPLLMTSVSWLSSSFTMTQLAQILLT